MLLKAPVAPPGITRPDLDAERTLRPVASQPPPPRPSLVVGGPAYFTPEGYQAPVQPEQAFMPTDRRPDPIGDNFNRPYERPIMTMPMPSLPIAQPRPPTIPIEQPVVDQPFEPGPITPRPVMPMPEPQPEYSPYAYSDIGTRALGGQRINSMNFHWFDPRSGQSGSTTEGWSRVPDWARPYTYLNKEEADEAKQNFMTYEDTGGAETSLRQTPMTMQTPITTPAPRTLGAPLPPGVDNQIDISDFLGDGNREETLESLQGIFGPQVRYANSMTGADLDLPRETISQPMPPPSMSSLPSLPSLTLPTLPTLPGRNNMPIYKKPPILGAR